MTSAVRAEIASRQDKHSQAEGKGSVWVCECVNAVIKYDFFVKKSVALKLILSVSKAEGNE